jgi:steroid delta-isomerase-like uncharacterized protein
MSAPAADGLIDAFYRAYNAGDAEAAAALYAPDGWHAEADGKRREGRAALALGLARFFAMLPDAQWEIRERIDAGLSVAVAYTMRGHLGIDLGATPTKGRAIDLPGIHIFDVSGGAIAGTRDYWDPVLFRRQAGLAGA